MRKIRLQSSDPRHDGVARITLAGLISLNQTASGVRMWESRIRSDSGDGFLSRAKGRGMEFDEVRPYTPGDDIRSLDWRVTARTGRTHTKLFREERERPVLLGIDLRASMFFATRGVFKSVQAMKFAALISWKAHQNGDRVGGQIFNDREYREVKPQNSKRSVLHFLKALSDLGSASDDNAKSRLPRSAKEEALESAITRLHRHSRPGSSIILISDFRDLNESCDFHLIRVAQHCDVILLMVFDPLEQRLPLSGRYRFSDGHRDIEINCSDNKTFERYRNMFQERCNRVKSLALKHRMRFASVNTGDDPLQILQSGLNINRDTL